MSTQTLTYDLDIAGAYVGKVDRQSQTDGLYATTSMISAFKKGWGEKMGPDWTAGEVETIPMTVRQHSTSTGLAVGTESINPVVQSTQEGIQFRHGRVIRPVMFNLVEVTNTMDQGGFNEALAQRFVEAKMACMREYNQHVVAGGVGAYENAGTGYFSINGIDRTYGFLEEDAVGSQSRTIGGFSKATYAATALGTQNAVADVASLFSANGSAQMFALRQYIRQWGPMGTQKGYLALLTIQAFDNYKRTLQGREMYTSEKDIDGGWVPLVFGDCPIFVETYLPISTTYGGSASNTNKMSGVIFHPKSIFPKWEKAMTISGGQGGSIKVPGGRFERSDFRQFQNQYVWSAEIHVGGQLMINNWANHGLLLNAETWA